MLIYCVQLHLSPSGEWPVLTWYGIVRTQSRGGYTDADNDARDALSSIEGIPEGRISGIFSARCPNQQECINLFVLTHLIISLTSANSKCVRQGQQIFCLHVLGLLGSSPDGRFTSHTLKNDQFNFTSQVMILVEQSFSFVMMYSAWQINFKGAYVLHLNYWTVGIQSTIVNRSLPHCPRPRRYYITLHYIMTVVSKSPNTTRVRSLRQIGIWLYSPNTLG